MPDPILGDVADGDTFKCILFQRIFGQTVMNVLHYVCTDPTGAPPDRFQVCRELSNALLDAPTGIWPQLRANQSNQITHVSHRVQFLREIDFTYPFFEELVGEPGDRSPAALLANTALSIEKRADVSGTEPRQGIGRLQLAGVPTEVIVAGEFTDAYLDDFANVTQDMADPITLTSGVEVSPCLSRKGATLWTDSIIFQCVAKKSARVMNRRTVGRGI